MADPRSQSIQTLRHGAKLAVAEMPWMESISLGIYVGIGSRHDPARLSGLAHFAEHLFFKGTKKRNARQLSLDIESVGGSADAFTSEEHTCFYLRGPAEEFPHFAEVLVDMFLGSTFPLEEVEREREVISEEISMYQEQPGSRAEDLLCRTMWPEHPLGRPISGDEASLRRIRRADLLDHAASFYGQKNTVLALAGRIETEEAVRTLNQVLGRRLPSGRKPAVRRNPRQHFGRGPKMAIDRRETEQTQLALACHGPGRDKANAHALKLLNVLVGENTSSRLWHELREKRGWCYQIDSDVTPLSDTGLFQVFAGVDPANLDRAAKLIWKELRHFAERPVPKSELDRAVAYTIGSGRLSLESTASQMMWIGESLLFHGSMITIEEAHRRLKRITPEQLQRLAAQLFRPENLGLAVVGPVNALKFTP